MASSSTLKWVLVGEDKTGRAFKSAASGLDVLAQKSKDVGRSLSLSVTAPLAGIAAVGIKTASEFGVTMASMQVNSGATAAEMETLRETALKLGADTVFSAGESADAMLELSKAGLTVGEIGTASLGALKSTMALAATEGMGLADAASIMANAMNTYSISAEESARVSDVLAAGAVASTTSVQGLAAGLKYVGSSAKAIDLSIEDTVTALAALNNAGIDASTAGTSLNQFLLNLVPATSKAEGAMQELGLEFVNANGSMKSMPEIIDQLSSAFDGMEAADRSKALREIFGVRGMRVANTLLKDGAKGWQELSSEVNKGGVAQELADARMAGMAGAIESMRGSLETAALTIGETLAPKVIMVSGKIQELVNWFTNLSAGTKNVITNVGIAAAALGPLLWGFGKAIELGKSVVSGFQMLHKAWQVGHAIARVYTMGLLAQGKAMLINIGHGIKAAATWVAQTAAMVAHKAASVALSAATKAMAVAQWALNVAMTANPIGLVIAAIVALGAGLVLAYKKSETFRKIVNTAFVVVGKAVLTLAEYWLKGYKLMTTAFLSFVGTLLNGAAKAFGWIPGVGGKLKSAASAFEGFKTNVSGQFDKVIGKVGEWKSSLDRVDGKTATAKIDVDPSGARAGAAKAQGYINGVDGRTVPINLRFFKTGEPYIRQPGTNKVIPLATGGIVTAPTLALVGEAGPEAVVPLNKAGGFGAITVNVYGGLDGSDAIARRVQSALLDLKRRQGVSLGLA